MCVCVVVVDGRRGAEAAAVAARTQSTQSKHSHPAPPRRDRETHRETPGNRRTLISVATRPAGGSWSAETTAWATFPLVSGWVWGSGVGGRG